MIAGAVSAGDTTIASDAAESCTPTRPAATSSVNDAVGEGDGDGVDDSVIDADVVDDDVLVTVRDAVPLMEPVREVVSLPEDVSLQVTENDGMGDVDIVEVRE